MNKTLRCIAATLAIVSSGTVVKAQATLISHFDFNGNLLDALGNGTATLYNNSAVFYSADTLDWFADSVAANTNGGGLRITLPDAVFSEDNYSIEIDFKLGETSGYRKILDFLGLGADAGAYVNDQLRLYSGGGYGSTTLNPQTYYKLVMTRETATDTARLYLFNGSTLMLESKTQDIASYYVAVLNSTDRVIDFFHDDTLTVTEFSNSGHIDRIRIWNGIVTAADLLNGVNDVSSAQQVDLYPNPAKENTMLVITPDKSGAAQIVISDISGRTVREQKQVLAAGENRITLNTSDLTKGVYLVQVKSMNGTTTKRLIVE